VGPVVLGLAALTALAVLLAGWGSHARAVPQRPGDRLSSRIAATAAGTRHDEYVFVDSAVYVYDIDHGQRLVARRSLPGITRIRGVAADIRTHMLYISHGGYGGNSGNGSLAKYDLVTGRVIWNRGYGTGVDSLAVSRDGRRLYLPDGELSTDGMWLVLDARTGSVIRRIRGGDGPHNTIVSPDGRRVYLGPRNSPYLSVASTASDRIIRRIGPLYSGVRPFTINARQTLAYTTATGLLGFQVSSIHTGRVLDTVRFAHRFERRYDPSTFPLTAPSHGISLSPNGRQLWVLDTPNAYVHVFEVAGRLGRSPRRVADIALSDTFTGNQTDCSYDCEREGWLQQSVSGCFVYVGDSGDVLSAVTLRRVGYLPAMRNSREMLEIDWRHGVPVATSTRSGVGYPHAPSRPSRRTCR
jgi:DNA-binding beta-propeller fold protein YncE